MGNDSNDNIYDQIYNLVRLIPTGRVTTYGAIAKALGVASGARLVGYAMNSSHGLTPPIPAHRVVNRVGLLSGKHHFGPNDEMKQLLESEGLTITDDKIERFDAHFWNPSVEL
jgi:methylated-DNA-protein-cysteine methyltransferase-like protein